jgi:hypothetical protein
MKNVPDKKELSSHFGIKLLSQYTDPAIYEKVRKIQEYCFKALGVAVPHLIIIEYPILKTYFYEIRNKKLGLKGFIGRCNHTGRIVYLVRDEARISWAQKEGFLDGVRKENFEKEVYSSLGILIQVEAPADLALFLAGCQGYKTRGNYLKAG